MTRKYKVDSITCDICGRGPAASTHRAQCIVCGRDFCKLCWGKHKGDEEELSLGLHICTDCLPTERGQKALRTLNNWRRWQDWYSMSSAQIERRWEEVKSMTWDAMREMREDRVTGNKEDKDR